MWSARVVRTAPLTPKSLSRVRNGSKSPWIDVDLVV
jgi:hypothetical protein